MADGNIEVAFSFIAMSIIISTMIYSGAITGNTYMLIAAGGLMLIVKLWR